MVSKSGIPDEICNPCNIPLLVSWTHINKKIYPRELKSAVIQYMPTVPQPVNDYVVLHSYLQFLLQTVETLELKNIFAHCDEAVYSKLLHIIWSNVDTFKSITPFLGCFHKLMTDQKILYVKHGCIGFDKWFSSSGILKSELAAENAFSGRHYNSGIRVLKESFDAIVQMRTEGLTNNHKNVEPNLLQSLLSIRKEPTADNVECVLDQHPHISCKKLYVPQILNRK